MASRGGGILCSAEIWDCATVVELPLEELNTSYSKDREVEGREDSDISEHWKGLDERFDNDLESAYRNDIKCNCLNPIFSSHPL